MNAEMHITIDNDECNIKLNGTTDLLVSGICAAIQALVEKLLDEYEPTDFDTEGMTEEEIRDCMTALVLTYIMDCFDKLFTNIDIECVTKAVQDSINAKEQSVISQIMEQHIDEDEEEQEHIISDNIDSLNFDCFGNNKNNEDTDEEK